MRRFVLALLFAFFGSAFAVDSLEVFVLLVDFQEEKPDNSLTTGTGKFNSDTKKTYKLDPSGVRANAGYWKRHFDFANAYFQAASGGKLAVKARIFPETSVYTLDKQIIDYNRTSKKKGEKTAEYDESRSRDYMTFIYDAVAKAHKSSASPFNIAKSENPNTKRVYMIVHAGASRLVDGGSMGTRNADTPADFMDIFVNRSAWEYLLPDSAKDERVKPAMGLNENGDTVSVGLILKGAAIDTLENIMVVSETASQDGLNWGINGIIVNQIARELGLPDTYDVVKGISRLGYFDMMDFAGYNAGNGFLPSLPAAWDRAYMGWSKVKEVRPTAGHPVTVDIAAAGSGLGTEIVKVPLNGSEYLLIENRQRSWNKDGTVEVAYTKETSDAGDVKTTKVPVDSISLLFEDSTCKNGKCKPNGKQLSGFILKPGSFDAGLPASGIAVWKVNDWYLRETLQYGVANFWGGDTLRDHQFGISLTEADGVLSIGKTFKNALGEDTYDYGSGTDLLPHLRYGGSSSSKMDTVKVIKPTGYANTATTQGGYTGIKITVNVPKDARKEKTANAFMGDSVVNFVAPVISVTISIDDGSIENSKFPRNIGVKNAVRGAVFIDSPDNNGEKIMVVGSEDGTLQAFDALGDTLFPADTSVLVPAVSKVQDSVDVPLYRIGNFGKLLGMASDGKFVYSLHEEALVRSHFESGMYPVSSIFKIKNPKVGPVVALNRVWVATEDSLLSITAGDVLLPTVVSRASLKDYMESFVPEDMAFCQNQDKRFVIIAGEKGNALIGKYLEVLGREIPPSMPMTCLRKEGNSSEAISVMEYRAPMEIATHFNFVGIHFRGSAESEKFRVSCTDLERDGYEDALFLGSRGTLVKQPINPEAFAPGLLMERAYKRGASGKSGLMDETSGMAIGDINGDGYPEIVFLGDNLLYALDRYHLPLPNFPVTLSRGTPVVGFGSDPLLVDVTGDDVPEILVPSSDGLVYAYTGKGKQLTTGFPIAAGSFEYGETFDPMSIYVVDALPDKKSKGPELYTFHRNNVAGFRLNKAANGAEKNVQAWALPAAGNERTGYFDASLLGEVKKEVAKDEIKEFFVYPNPIREGFAQTRFELGAEAEWAEFEIYDITGLCVYSTHMSWAHAGRNETIKMDLRKLGSDVYTARLKVKFKSGKTKQKLYRIGVVR